MPSTYDPSLPSARERFAIAALQHFLLLAIVVSFCFILPVSGQTSGSQPSDADQSWTSTRESHTDVSSTRTVESHVKSGNRTLDKQSIEERDASGNIGSAQDNETESVQVNASTVRTTTRTFERSNGIRTLIRITEDETQTLPGGGSKSVRTVSNPDSSGNVQVFQREISETKKISRDVEVTKTTVMMPSVNGGLAPAMQIEERQQRNGNSTDFKKTTRTLDGGGYWQVSEVRQGTIKEDGKNRSTDERVSRPDPSGNLGEVSRTVKKESESPSGEKHNSVDTYSVDVPGSTRDGSLHMVQRETATQSASSTGQQTTVQKIEQPDPGNPSAGLRVVTITSDTVRSGPTGAQGTRTVQIRNGSGSFEVLAVDSAKTDNAHAIQVQIAPSEKSKPSDKPK